MKKAVNMTEGIIWKQLLLYVIPLVLGDVFQQCYSVVDSIIVGRFVSKQALAAVSSTESIINTMIGIFTGISTGATIVIARYYGAKDERQLKNSIHTAILLSLLLSIALTLAGICGTPIMLRMLSTPEDVYPYAKSYLQIYFLGFSGLVLYNMCGGILRAVGDSKRPLDALILASGLNIALDLLFVIVFHTGVAGAAIATILSQFLSALFLLYILCLPNGICQLDLKQLTMKRDILFQILNSGLPIGIQKSLVAFSNTLVLANINYFGSGAMAAWGIYRKLGQTITHITQNMSLTVSTFVSQNIGAKRQDRIQRGMITAAIISLILTVSLDAILLLFRHPIIALFNKEPDVLAYGLMLFSVMFPWNFLMSIYNIQIGAMRGIGDSKGPMIIMLACFIVFRQLYLNIGWQFYKSITFVASCYPFAWFCNVTLMAIYKRARHSKCAPPKH